MIRRHATLGLLLAVVLLGVTRASVGENADISSSDNSDFDRCICWDRSTDSWCADNGKTTFWRDSCNDYVRKAALWTIPAALLLTLLLLFPFFFVPGRYCCKCCGGSVPSYGCCCPTTAPEVLRDASAPLTEEYLTSMPTRVYSNRAILVAKLGFIFLMAGYIYFSVGVYTTSTWIHGDTHDVLDVMETTNTLAWSDLNMSVAALTALKTFDSTIVSATDVATLNGYLSDASHTRGTVTTNLNDARKVEDASWGRQNLTMNLISIPTMIFAIGLLFCVCNIRGLPVVALVVLMSFAAAIVTGIFMVHMVMAQLSVAACTNFNSTIVPALVAAAESKKVCGYPLLESTLNSSAHTYVANMCAVGLSTLCANYYVCTMNPCSAYENIGNRNNMLTYGSVNVDAIRETITSATPRTTCPGCGTIQQCGQTSGCSQHPSAMAVLTYYQQLPQVASLNNQLYATTNCDALLNQLQAHMGDALCGSFKRNYTSLAIVSLAAMLISSFAVLGLVSASKRFQKMELRPQDTSTAQNFVYGVLVTSPEEREAVGSPMHNPAREETAPPVGYGSIQESSRDYPTKTFS